MNAPCRGYRRAVLLASPAAVDDAHASHCEGCKRWSTSERRAAELVRANRPSWQAPVELRERVTATLEQERARKQVRTFLARRLAIGSLAAVAAGLVIALVVSRHEPSGAEGARAAVDFLVADHLEFARRGPDRLKVASASPTEVQAYFEEHMELAPRIPPLGGARLLGGRRCSLGGNPAALVFYEYVPGEGDEPESISLFVFEPRGADFAAVGETVQLGERRAVEISQRGVSLLLWEERGLVYALAGAVEAHELRRLIGVTP